jgi:hypothetical protein
MTKRIKAAVKKLPYAREVVAKRAYERFVPPGHFYSPIPSLDEIQRDEARIFGSMPRTIAGIDMNEAAQLRLLEAFVPIYDEMPFTPEKQDGLRYFFDNPTYSYSDGICLHAMIRHVRPARIIEIGCGYSSCMMLDTNERFFGGAIDTNFVDPYPEALLSAIGPQDRARLQIVNQRLQDVDLTLFDRLRANDILFVDSTHVSRVDSDVNTIFFAILPRLASGVYIHVHDVFYPFEYPKEWIFEGRAWNEAYLLRAFLEYNQHFEVVLMNTFMEEFHREFFARHMPLCLKNPGGSIWLRKR